MDSGVGVYLSVLVRMFHASWPAVHHDPTVFLCTYIDAIMDSWNAVTYALVLKIISCKHNARSILIANFCSSSPATDCGDPGTPTNGQHSLSSTTYNSVVTYTCDVGYTLQGSNSRTCQSSGQWSGSVPQCLGTWSCRFADLGFYILNSYNECYHS